MVPRTEKGCETGCDKGCDKGCETVSALHGRDEVWLGQDVILQLDVEDASPLRVHHQEGVVKILK